MSPIAVPTTKRQHELKGAHVLATLLTFFGVVFAVNGVLVFEALKTHSGVVAQEPYRKGLAYNERIAADELQSALGWKADLGFGSAGQLTLNILDRENRPLSALLIAGSLGRPATERLDTKLSFSQTTPGSYLALTGIMDAGAWLISIEVWDETAPATSSEPIFRMRRKLWLRP